MDLLAAQFLGRDVRLQQVLPLIVQLAAGRHFDHRQQAAERRFAAARLADHRQRFAALQGEGDAVQRLDQPLRREQALFTG